MHHPVPGIGQDLDLGTSKSAPWSTCKIVIDFHQTPRAPRKMKIENVKNDVSPRFRFQQLFWGSRSTKYCACHTPATKTEPEASEVQHLPRGIIIRFYIKNEPISQNETFDPFKTFQNVVQVHQIPRVPGKVTSKTTSQFDPRLANVLATCR